MGKYVRLFLAAFCCGGVQASAQAVTSYFVSTDDSQHAYYIAGNQHVMQVWFSGQAWGEQDLTTLSGASVLPITASALSSYFVSSDGSSHIYYVGTDQHVYHLYYNGQGWFNQDLWSLSGATVLASTSTGLSCYFIASDGSTHVYYVGTNQHIYHVYYNGQGWFDQDLTAASGSSVLAGTASALSSYFVTSDGSSHIYYVGTTQHVYHLYYNGQGWFNQDLWSLSGASVLAASSSGLSSYFVASDGSTHVYYVGTNQHIYHVYYNGQGWINQDILAAGNGALAATNSSLTAFFVSADTSSHIFYIGSNYHIYQLYYNGEGWYDQDLTSLSGASAVAESGSGLASYFIVADDSSHVYYLDTNQHVNELVFNGTAWYDLDLMQIYSVSGQVTARSIPLAGATLTLTGATTGVTVTDSNGNYSFGLAARGSYTVTPSLSGYVFVPSSQTFNNLTTNMQGNFAAGPLSAKTPAEEYIYIGGSPIAIENSH